MPTSIADVYPFFELYAYPQEFVELYVGSEGLNPNNTCPFEYIIILISLIFAIVSWQTHTFLFCQLDKECLAYVVYKR